MSFIAPVPQNSPVTFTVVFYDQNSNPIDPASSIQIQVRDPNGGLTTFSYPGSVTRNSPGSYSVTAAVTLEGQYRAKGVGTLSSGLVVSTFDTVVPVTPTAV